MGEGVGSVDEAYVGAASLYNKQAVGSGGFSKSCFQFFQRSMLLGILMSCNVLLLVQNRVLLATCSFGYSKQHNISKDLTN